MTKRISLFIGVPENGIKPSYPDYADMHVDSDATLDRPRGHYHFDTGQVSFVPVRADAGYSETATHAAIVDDDGIKSQIKLSKPIVLVSGTVPRVGNIYSNIR